MSTQGDPPAAPHDYRIGEPLGRTARPRKNEPAYTQMKYGPRADPAMTDPLDGPDDLGNIKGQPDEGSGAGMPGRSVQSQGQERTTSDSTA